MKLKLKAHDKIEAAFDLLEESDPFKVMQKSKEILPNDAVSDEWKQTACGKIREAVLLKFQACEYAKHALLDSGLMIVEATGDRFWGSGLALDQTRQCLPEYWPRETQMGKILMDLCQRYADERDSLDKVLGAEGKCKATSPLLGSVKQAEHGT